MPRTRRPRLSWFRFYVDDFVGGVSTFNQSEIGQYLLLLLTQWASRSRMAIPVDEESLRMICRGAPSPKVLAKFEQCEHGLRNPRMAQEWTQAKQEYDGKASSGSRGMDGDTAPIELRKGQPGQVVRDRIRSRDGQCLRCGTTSDLTVDHIVPSAIGGDNDPSNLQTLCRSCNCKRPVSGQQLVEDLKRWNLLDGMSSHNAAIVGTYGAVSPTIQEPRSKNQDPNPELKPSSLAIARVTWITPFFDAWVLVYGGKPAGGKLARFIKPLVTEHGEAIVLDRWRRYLAETEAEYASPARFAETFGSWGPNRSSGKPTAGEQTVTWLLRQKEAR